VLAAVLAAGLRDHRHLRADAASFGIYKLDINQGNYLSQTR